MTSNSVKLDTIDELKEKLVKKEKELKNLGKNRTSLKTLFSIVVLIFSALYYIKTTKDQNLLDLTNSKNNELKAKEEIIKSLNKQLEVSQARLKSELTESHAMAKTISESENDLKSKQQTIENLKQEFSLKDIDLQSKQETIEKLKQDLGSKDKRIDGLISELQLKNTENDDILKRTNLFNIVSEAREGSSKVLYSANQTKGDDIISVAKDTLFDEHLVFCREENINTSAEFDVYRSCYRDLSIVLHNHLIEKFGHDFVVVTGSADHCFMITKYNEQQREEYFFTIGDIYFEVFHYINTSIESETKNVESVETKSSNAEKVVVASEEGKAPLRSENKVKPK